MEIAILLFDEITALDAVGPYEVLSRLPDAKVTFVGKQVGLQRTENRMLALQADRTIGELQDPDILVIPGGFGTRAVAKDQEVLDWIRYAHARSLWTTSVCTGSLLLGAAGLLDGLEATTHWLVMDALAQYGAKAVSRRIVQQGKIITCSGVASGIDMALTLASKVAGPEWAQGIQLGIEYDPEPPFVGGSPRTAPAAIIELVRSRSAELA
jgi:transcriptional regulator GlxA family with amidase domain